MKKEYAAPTVTMSGGVVELTQISGPKLNEGSFRKVPAGSVGFAL